MRISAQILNGREAAHQHIFGYGNHRNRGFLRRCRFKTDSGHRQLQVHMCRLTVG
jgi:hypothetical protein